MISVKIFGINRLISNLNQINPELFNDVKKSVVDEAYDYARQYAMVDKGELKDSIYKTGDTIGATAPHAVWNEWGCYNIPEGTRVNYKGNIGRTPFLRPAAQKAVGNAGKIFGDKLRYRFK